MQHLITLQLFPPNNRFSDVLGLPGLAEVEIDRSYGLVSISPKRGLYTIRVLGNVDRDKLMAIPEVYGVYGDVRVAPIDPTNNDAQ